MPVIEAKREGACAACGGRIQRTEQAWYTQEGGLRHPWPKCMSAEVQHRPNRHAGTCRCGKQVRAREGHLVREGERWVVLCRPGCGGS